MFRYDSLSGTWQEEVKLLASDGAAYDRFGYSVSLSGTTALIGARENVVNGTESGSAYVFGYDVASGSWSEKAMLVPPDGIDEQYFGWSVSLSEKVAVVGARGDDDNGHISGSAYVFSALENWKNEAKLLASDGANGDDFGCSVAAFDDMVLIGADRDRDLGQNSGSAYVFDFSSTLGLDIKCNGEDRNVIVGSNENVTLTVELETGYHPLKRGDIWITLAPISTGNIWTYGPHSGPAWQPGWFNEFFTGYDRNHTATVLDQSLPVGSYNAFLLFDLEPDGELNPWMIWDFDHVDFTVQ